MTEKNRVSVKKKEGGGERDAGRFSGALSDHTLFSLCYYEPLRDNMAAFYR